MKLAAKIALAWILLVCSNFTLRSQPKKVLINAPDAVYELTSTGAVCTYKSLPGFCNTYTEGIYSTALYEQTFYFLSFSSNKLYSVELGDPASCKFVTSFPNEIPGWTLSSIVALTVDKHGILYAVDQNSLKLFRFNPFTKQMTTLGRVPVLPGGDLVFYKDKLLLSTAVDGLYEINLANPAASTQYMSTGNYSFWGMISFPFDCDKNKIYGFSPNGPGTDLVELDLETKTVGAVVCNMPIMVYDAASIVETGNTLGIYVDSIAIQAPCEATQLTGNASIVAYSATPGPLKYTLSNGLENNTGKFTQLDRGTYQVRITNAMGCIKDTSFTITQGMDPNMLVTVTHPQTCQLPNGSILINAFSNYQPITIRVNNGPAQINQRLTSLGAGIYHISLRDGGSCSRDTTIVLNYPIRPDFLGIITTQPTFCEAKSGSIDVATNEAGVKAALDGGNFLPALQFNNLRDGYYKLAVVNTNNCRFDTLIQIAKLSDPSPQVTLEKTDQFCFIDNGKVTIQATGAGSPFNFSLNNSAYAPVNSFDKLAPGNYTIGIRNSHLCLWDTAVEIKPYIKQPVNVRIDKKDPICRVINSGELRVHITGAEGPFFFEVDNKIYRAGETVHLPPGEYLVKILNREQCFMESIKQELVLQVEPECDRMSMPNAFSPNDDGNNDLFKPLHTPYLTQVVLTIYNRYGQIVFRSSPKNHGWDGKLGAQQASQGYYAWQLTYRDFRGEPKKMNGLVMLVR